MKIIKLLLSFILILGIVIGILYLTGSFGDSGTGGGSDPKTFAEQSSLLDDEWQTASWDINLYKKGMIRLRQNEEALGEDGMKTLIDKLNEYAIPKLRNTMMKEFAKTDCNASTIETLYKSLEELKSTTPGREKHEGIVEMSGTYKIYKEAMRLCSAKIAFNPGDGTNWTPLANQKKAYLDKRASIKSDPYYKFIQNITDIKNGLNTLDSRLNAAATNFKNDVAQRIIKKYSSRKESADEFFRVKSKFQHEFGSHSSLDNLADQFLF